MNASEIVANVTLQQLRYFLAVAEGGSFTPGDRIARSQPAVSRGIRQLERILGRPLFHPEDRRRLTDFGREALAEARAILGLVESLGRKAEDARAAGEVAGPLLIGTKLSLAYSELPLILARLKKKHPKLEIRVRSKGGRELAEMLSKGEVELVFSHERTSEPGHEFLPLSRRRQLLVAPRSHPLLSMRKLTPQALAAQEIVLSEHDSRMARVVRERLGRHAKGGRLKVSIELMGAEARSRYVAQGWGVAIADEGFESGNTPGLAARPIPESILPSRTVGVYTMKGRYLSAAAQEFLGECRKAMRG